MLHFAFDLRRERGHRMRHMGGEIALVQIPTAEIPG